MEWCGHRQQHRPLRTAYFGNFDGALDGRFLARQNDLLAAQGSPKIVKEAFVAGTEPAREYSARWSSITTLPWYQQRPFYIPKEGEKMPQKGGPPPPGGTPAVPTNPPPGGEGY